MIGVRDEHVAVAVRKDHPRGEYGDLRRERRRRPTTALKHDGVPGCTRGRYVAQQLIRAPAAEIEAAARRSCQAEAKQGSSRASDQHALGGGVTNDEYRCGEGEKKRVEMPDTDARSNATLDSAYQD